MIALIPRYGKGQGRGSVRGVGRQRGRVVTGSDSQSGEPEFVSHWPLVGLFRGSPEFSSSTTFVNSQHGLGF